MKHIVLHVTFLPVMIFAQADGPNVTTKTTELGGGAIQLTIQNNSDRAMTAYAYSFILASGRKEIRGERFYDSALFFGQQAIAPHRTAVEQEGGPNITNVQFTFRAAVFSDGSSFGDAAWAQRIIVRRQLAAQAIDRLQSAVAQSGTDTPALIVQLNVDLSTRMATTSDRDQQEIERRFTGIIIENLDQLSASGKDYAATRQATLAAMQRAKDRLAAASGR